ncbi:hypothetical protein NLJ89_g2776 [Agrocybe chaxingu]|uniref:NAD(P)H-hydrate epimerase n=1 Tax=Agrocybe chaxingu TaxID=84603 RepID=A0A9W8MYR4_9AGAR|nr:hypothetical protein NLJ89_g2776 [Agrocybe chaxingu]
MPRTSKNYSIFLPPSLSMTELVKTTLDHDSTDMLIDRWLEHRNNGHDPYYEWFRDTRERKHGHLAKQTVAWNKGGFVPENVFCRTVDTGRLIPLDRTWTTHVYHHHTMQDRKLPMMPVVFTMLPELMLLRGMHDTGCDEIYIVVTDLKRQEMDDVAEYFKLASRYCFGRPCKPSIEERIQREHMRLSHTLLRQRRTPCFPQIDLTLRAILYEKRPRFLVLFSHHTTSYSQIFFTDPSYIPDEDIFYDYPTGCPNPCCTDDCEIIRFPRRGIESAAILQIKTKDRRKRIRAKDMCNWIDCDVAFGETSRRRMSTSAIYAASADLSDTVPPNTRERTGRSIGDLWSLQAWPALKLLQPSTEKTCIRVSLSAVAQEIKVGMFGYQPTIYMPKPGSKDIYQRLQKQCENMKIPVLPPSNDVDDLRKALHDSDVILDAIFGFSFKPPIRSPFDVILPLLNQSRLPIVSVDIPSGWDVEKGNDLGVGLRPNVLVSLTAPKQGVKDYTGRHFLGGRFVPKCALCIQDFQVAHFVDRILEERFELHLPHYPDSAQIVELDSESSMHKY